MHVSVTGAEEEMTFYKKQQNDTFINVNSNYKKKNKKIWVLNMLNTSNLWKWMSLQIK